MKPLRFFLLLSLCLVAGVLYAQTPQAINSQAVLRDAAGRLIANQPVGVRITIAQGSPTGTAAYVETHAVTTNDNGLYTITIGAGTPSTGTFADIDWGNGPYFITTDIDPAGGSNYTITTNQQFLSVPYALFADTAARVAQAHTAHNANHATNADASTTSLHADRADYADTALYYQERQVLTLGHDTIYLTGGSYVVLPPSGNANINNRYIDSVIRANNSTVVNHYVDSVVRANNTTVVNNIQNQISDSIRQMQTTINNTITTQMRDSIIAIIRDSATIVQQTIAAVPTNVCHASCGRVDSLRRRLDSIIHIYDSLSRRLAQRIDSVSAANPANPCLGHSFIGTDNQTACESYTWMDGNTYTSSTSTPTHTLVGGSAAGCDSTVTLHLTINHGTHNATSQSTCSSYSWHGNTYSSTGNYVYTYTNAAGCASADTLHFTKRNTTTGIDNQTACESYTWMDGNTYTSSTSTPTHTLVGANAAGCDSTVTLHLTINHGTHNVETQSATGSYTWHGSSYSSSGNYVYTYTNASGCASADTLHLTINIPLMSGCECSGTVATNGVLPGIFSVSATQRVKFSQGNLQYKASTDTWRFAECQCQYVGETGNENVSSTYDGWIDLFGWGTSGYHDPVDTYNTNYMPYATSDATVNTNFNWHGYGPSTNQTSRSLTGSSAHYDWGIHNAIINGGNAAGMWRTLTKDEWVYLMNTRTTSGVVGSTSNARYCKATVSGVNGLIIFPNSYVHPAGVPVPSHTNQTDADFSDTFTASQWSSMESAGCVFLPAAGFRNLRAVGVAGNRGYYWLSTCQGGNGYNSEFAYCFYFLGGVDMSPQMGSNRAQGNSVRLVQDLCLGQNTSGIDNQTACESYTWIDGNTYTSSTSTPTHTLVGANVAGCDSTVTLHLTINHGTHNATSQSSCNSYTWHGNTYSSTGNYVYTYTNASGCASADTLHLTITIGALPGEFSVSASKRVKFSQGNLQYQASTDTWRFAEHQYDYVGNSTLGNVYVDGVKSYNNVSSTYNGWIDLFVWGTSGNLSGLWRTLTIVEWEYLVNTRSTTGVVGGTSNARYCKANVSGVNGLIIFPDSYVHPTDVLVPSHTNQKNADYSDTFTASQWSSMETAGCVFLPAAGFLDGGAICQTGFYGNYWSSSFGYGGYSYSLNFFRDNINILDYDTRWYSFSVRLVQDVN